MKRTTILLLSITVTGISYANGNSSEIYLIKNNFINSLPTAYDTSGIYISQTDFVNDTLQFKTAHKIKIRTFPLVNNFSVNEEATPLKVRLPGGKKKILTPGTFYGFKTEGVKFIYIRYLNEYLAVLNDTSPVYLFVRKRVHFSGIAAFADAILYFSTNLTDSLKEFNVENIKTSFGEASTITQTLTELLQQIKKKGLDVEMHKKQFLQSRRLVEQYLSKLKSQ